jgi:DNA-directed RNA polymerase specialized sigma24 family protein
LTPPQGELFVLKHLYGWTQQELAKRFDMTTSAVGVSIHRTKISLQQQLNDPKERSTP